MTTRRCAGTDAGGRERPRASAWLRRAALLLPPFLALGACTNDFGRFGGAESADDGLDGGSENGSASAETSSGAGGEDSEPRSASMSGGGGSPGAAESASTGPSGVGGASPGDAEGGAAGQTPGAGAATGEAGAPGQGGECEASELLCGTSCVDVEQSQLDCGACGVSCLAQSLGFTCVEGACGCVDPSDCGEESSDVECVARRCGCSDTLCAAGETCRRRGNRQECTCNDGNACTEGETCCPAAGCRDTADDVEHCGGCGRRCPDGASCVGGQCV